jgi:hypothetical protein
LQILMSIEQRHRAQWQRVSGCSLWNRPPA